MSVIIFDTETTGLPLPDASPLSQQPYITEYCACRIEPDGSKRWYETLIKVPIPLSPEITKITGLTDADLEGQPTFLQQVDAMKEFCIGARRWVAHNIEFDLKLMKYDLMRIGHQMKFPWPLEHVDTVAASLPIKGRRMKLAQLHMELFGEKFEGAHRARADVEALVRCYEAMVEKGLVD